MATSTPNKSWRWGKLRGPATGMRTLRPTARTLASRPGAEGPNGRVYGSQAWKDLRAKLIKQHPYCSRCGARGGRLYADHRVELRDGGPAFDPSNIDILCASCHQTKTAEARRARAGAA